jgi:hypothetical protein
MKWNIGHGQWKKKPNTEQSEIAQSMTTSILPSQNFTFQVTIYLEGNLEFFLKHQHIYVCTEIGCTYFFLIKKKKKRIFWKQIHEIRMN